MNARKLLTLPYRAYRTPLAVLESRVASRLRDDAPPRLVLERVLGTYDRFAGRLLKDAGIAQQGEDRLERTHKLVEAAELEQQAAERRTNAEKIAAAAERKAQDKAEQAAERLEDGLDAADETERRGKQAAAERARSAATQRKQAAEAKAGQRLRSVEASVEQTETVADARTKRAHNTAKAKLTDAAEQRSGARGKRADAEQLDSLVEAKRNERTTN